MHSVCTHFKKKNTQRESRCKRECTGFLEMPRCIEDDFFFFRFCRVQFHIRLFGIRGVAQEIINTMSPVSMSEFQLNFCGLYNTMENMNNGSERANNPFVEVQSECWLGFRCDSYFRFELLWYKSWWKSIHEFILVILIFILTMRPASFYQKKMNWLSIAKSCNYETIYCFHGWY